MQGFTFSSAGTMALIVEGLTETAADFDNMDVRAIAAKALNATSRRFRTESSRAIRSQVAFPARYLDAAETGALRVIRQARPEMLETAIRGRDRATSLARFIPGGAVTGMKSPRVRVEPWSTKTMKRAFIMNLNSGNLGLAVRLRPGEVVENKKVMVGKSKGVYLLYGPSVDQVFKGVSRFAGRDAADYLETEFIRLMEVFG